MNATMTYCGLRLTERAFDRIVLNHLRACSRDPYARRSRDRWMDVSVYQVGRSMYDRWQSRYWARIREALMRLCRQGYARRDGGCVEVFFVTAKGRRAR